MSLTKTSNLFQLITPLHEEHKVQLVPSDLEFEGLSTLPQFTVKSITIAEQKSYSRVDVLILLDRIFSYHLTNTFIPTIR